MGMLSQLEDLKFFNQISNLMGIALKHFNKEEELKRELIQVKEYVTELENERDLREQFVSILAHDLRTPLTSAKMAAQYVLRRPDNIEKTKTQATRVVSSIDRMDQMIKDLLDANRIRAGEPLSMSMSPGDLKMIVVGVLKELSLTYGDRLRLESDHLPIQGYWNEGGIRRVLENLISNAVKYGEPKGPISITLKTIDQQIQIIVHNFGNPIPLKEQLLLFQPFHRVATNINEAGKGWGLGLTLVRGVAVAHGGNVVVQSNEKDGTSFIVTIPKDARPFQIH